MKFQIKIVTGFRDEQHIIIPMQEAHKAYYLFKNPEERGVFENGMALIGKNIQAILPAWNETMGWNATHKLNDDDWNEIRKLGVEEKMRALIEKAKEVGDMAIENPKIMELPLGEVIKNIPVELVSPEAKQLSDKFSLRIRE